MEYTNFNTFDREAQERMPSEKLLKAITELENGQTTTYNNLDDFRSSVRERLKPHANLIRI